MTTVEDVLAKIDSKMRKRMGTAEGWTAERQPLPSAGLTTALGGGLGYGRITTIHGSKSAGKSSMLLQMIAEAQREGKVCSWVDAEKAFDTAWATKLGVDCDNLILTRAADMARAGDEVVSLIEAGADIIVVDSISALIQPSYIEKDGTSLKGMDSTAKIGDFSKGLKAFIRSINYVNDKTLVILISQQTTFIGQTYTKQVPEGGKAIEFYSSQVIKLNSTPSKMIKKKVDSGNKVYEMAVGREVDWTVDFNKLGPAGGTGTYEFYFLGDYVGVDPRLEIIDAALELGVITKGGAWYTYGEERWQGIPKLVEWLGDKDNLEKVKRECEL